MALRSIGTSKMRSVLTMLGIIIGVMALVVLVSLINGATNSVTDAVAQLGTSSVTVTISDDKGQPISLDTLNAWMEQEPDIGLIAPYDTATVVGKFGGEYDSVTVYGTTPTYYDVQGLQLSMGRFLRSTDVDNVSYVCVLNQEAATELVGYEDCVEDEDSLMSVLTSGTMFAYIPATTLIRLVDSVDSALTQFYVSAPAGGTVDKAEAAIERLLLARFNEDDDAFTLSTSAMLEDAMADITNVMSILLGGIAAISLVVGGIGIMNIMMVTVTERTREIGIRKAIGASRGNILMQFLMEAVVLCMMGCGLGIFLSWAILQVVSTVVASTGIVFTLDGGVVALAVVFCFLIGVIFGLYPANKAAKMKPIDALHYGG